MTTQFPQPGAIPGIPPIMNNNAAPPPSYNFDQTQSQPETLDWSQWLDDANMAEPTIPTADYDALVINAVPTEAQNGKLMINITFRLISGQFAGKEFSKNQVWSPGNKKAMRVWFRQMLCLGLTDQFWRSRPTKQQICDSIINKQCRIQITQREQPPGSGLWDNEVGFIREGSSMINQGMQPAMLNQQGFPTAPQVPQVLNQQPQTFAPQQGYQGMPQVLQNVQDQQPQQTWQQYAPQQQPPQQGYPQGYPQGQMQPTQSIPVGPEYAQAPQQLAPQQGQPVGQGMQQMPPLAPQQTQQAPPPPPGQPQFENMLRPPQQGAQQGVQLPQPPSPYPQQPQAEEPTPGDAQPQPTQIPQDQAAQFAAFMAQQQAGQGQPQQPPPPPTQF